jgi:hypothetical protein
MVKTYKECAGQWIVWNTKNPENVVTIVAFDDWMMGRVKTRYRVDVSGRTVDSLIDTKAEALSSARQQLRKLNK